MLFTTDSAVRTIHGSVVIYHIYCVHIANTVETATLYVYAVAREPVSGNLILRSITSDSKLQF